MPCKSLVMHVIYKPSNLKGQSFTTWNTKLAGKRFSAHFLCLLQAIIM